jgi:hypothetical protein
VIKKSLLPVRGRTARGAQRFRQVIFQGFQPQRNFRPGRRNCDEQMNVIWHQDIAANTNAMRGSISAKDAESLMSARTGEKFLPLMGT